MFDYARSIHLYGNCLDFNYHSNSAIKLCEESFAFAQNQYLVEVYQPVECVGTLMFWSENGSIWFSIPVHAKLRNFLFYLVITSFAFYVMLFLFAFSLWFMSVCQNLKTIKMQSSYLLNQSVFLTHPWTNKHTCLLQLLVKCSEYDLGVIPEETR